MNTFPNDGSSSPSRSQIPVEINAAPVTPLPDRSQKQAAWISLLRRVLFLMISFGLAILLIKGGFRTLLKISERMLPGQELDWSTSYIFHAPVRDIVAERLPDTLTLLLAAFLFALALALVAVLAGALAHLLENKTGWPGSLLKGLGRMLLFPLGSAPSIILGLLLLIVFVFQLDLLPPAGMVSPEGNFGDFADRLRHLVLPALTLGFMPALLAAQSTTRRVTLPSQPGGIRLWLGGLCHLLGALLGQIGGWLGALIFVEFIFSWPGTGRLFIQALSVGDLQLLIGIPGTWAVIILIVRLLSELLRWGSRLLLGDAPVALPLTPQRKAARLVWVIIALALLLVPLGLAAAGLTVSDQQVNQVEVNARMQDPSAEHPLGTDTLGRDLLARVLRGSTNLVGCALAVVLLVLIPAAVGGALSGFLASRRTWITETISDLVLLLADILLFIPAIALGIVIRVTSYHHQQSHAGMLILVVALAMAPRAPRTFQALWLSAPRLSRVFTTGLGALFLATFYGATGLILGMDFLQLGVLPPTPTLGGIFRDAMQYLVVGSSGTLVIGLVVGSIALALYTAADALIGFFSTKDALLHLNE